MRLARVMLRDPGQNSGARENGLKPIGNQASGGPRGAWLSVAATGGGTQSLAGTSAAIDGGSATLTAMAVGSGPAIPTVASRSTVSLSRPTPPGTISIGHTRWATHARPSDENSHPHKVGPISVIHNGIIENHLALRAELAAGGAQFSSETDTEIFAHLVERETVKGADLATAVRRSLQKVRGSFAFVVMSDKEPDTLIAAKNSSPLVVGLPRSRCSRCAAACACSGYFGSATTARPPRTVWRTA